MSRLILLGIALFLSFSLCAGSLQEIDGTLHRLQSAANASLDGLNNTQQVELIQSLRHIAQTINNEVSTLEKSIDDFWILFAATLVFFMQAGFSMVEAGSVRDKNVKNILTKNMTDVCVGVISFWLLGYGFAYGDQNGNAFIGGNHFALSNYDDSTTDFPDFQLWFFQAMFAATASTIVSGCVAERAKFSAYLIYTIGITGFIYPVVAHWGWSETGFLSAFRDGNKFISDTGLIDFAGSGIVHTVGGIAGLVGAIILGPRIGRFDADGRPKTIPPHNAVLISLGSFILWFGWYGFNAGSTLAINGASGLASKVATTTTIAGAASALTVLIAIHFKTQVVNVIEMSNGVLAGLVSITAGCSVVSPVGSFCIGIIGALVYIGATDLLVKLKIDDPLNASPVHGACGIWGVIAVGLFATKNDVANAYDETSQYGLFAGGGGVQLGAQVVSILIIVGWTIVTSAILFLSIKYTIGMRVSEEDEKKGLDYAKHGGAAFPENERIRAATVNMKRIMDGKAPFDPDYELVNRVTLSDLAEDPNDRTKPNKPEDNV